MQLMIDISHETPSALRLAAQFLIDHAAIIEAGGLPAYTGGVPDVPAGTSVPVPPVVVVPPPPPPSDNVVPFPVPAPVPPSVGAASAIPPAPPAAASLPVATTSATPPNAPALPSVTPAAPAGAADEFDSSGMPWDARIHQKGKGKKKDGTWKLLKNLDAAIVTAVTQELANAGRIRTPGSVGAAAPVSVPQAPPVPPAPQGYQAGQLPIPPPPATGETAEEQARQAFLARQAQGVPVPPPPPVPSVTAQAEGQAQAGLVPPPPVPVPPAPVLGVPNTGNAPVVQGAATDFRSFVAKVTAARTSGKITAEQVTALIQQAGAPSLQLLNSMPHLIATADLLLDTHLAMA